MTFQKRPHCTGCTEPDRWDLPEGRTHQMDTIEHPLPKAETFQEQYDEEYTKWADDPVLLNRAMYKFFISEIEKLKKEIEDIDLSEMTYGGYKRKILELINKRYGN